MLFVYHIEIGLWLSDELFSYHSGTDGMSVTGSRFVPYWLSVVSNDIYLVDWYASLLVNTPLNGSNYWTATLSRRTPANVESDLATFSTAGFSGSGVFGTLGPTSLAVTHVGSSYPVVLVQGVKTGAPGTLFGSVVLRYRLIAV
jgi:hypothetical protein